MSIYDDQIKQMYGANLTSQKEQLKSSYEAADQALTLQKEENQKITESNLRQTRADAQKSAMNNEEYYAASGLTSGVKAQAKLARDNQLLSDLTTLRTAQQEADAQIELKRKALAQEYESAIAKAQADNDMELAKALYEQAQIDDERLLEQARLMAEDGDNSLLELLTAKALTSDQQIKLMQNWYGVLADGIWGDNSTAAAGGKSANEAWSLYSKYHEYLSPKEVEKLLSGDKKDIYWRFKQEFEDALRSGADYKELCAAMDELVEVGILTKEEGGWILGWGYTHNS